MKKKLERFRRLLRPPSRPVVLGSGSARTPRASRNRLGRCGGCRHRARSTPGSGPTMSGGYLAQRFCTAYDQAYAKDATPGPGSYENESDRHGLGITGVLQVSQSVQFRAEVAPPSSRAAVQLRRAWPSTRTLACIHPHPQHGFCTAPEAAAHWLQGPKSDNSFRDFSSSFGTSQRSSPVRGTRVPACALPDLRAAAPAQA